VNSAPPSEIYQDAPPHLSRSRLTLNEQLCLFGLEKDARPPRASVAPWVAVALAIVILPWALIGWAIWALA
jgi:hypothetical protein